MILPLLPATANKVLQQHNASTLQLLVATMTSVGAAHPQLLAAPRLPLSGAAFTDTLAGSGSSSPDMPALAAGSATPQQAAAAGEGPAAAITCASAGNACGLGAQLAALAVPSAVCSPFMALSGGGDSFSSLAELEACAPAAMQLQAPSLPLMGVADHAGRPLPLNAFLLDYFKHT